jgi:N-acetylglucosaminyl-diphospho-decaprenol L-rhamnosyltransferase
MTCYVPRVPLVDVVVVSYNSRAELRQCVESIAREEWVNVIIVDNASPDGSLEAIEDLPVTRVQLDTNGGFARGCNTGWRMGIAPYVLFLNPDARIDPESLRQLARVFEEDSRVGAAGPRIVDDQGRLEFSIRRFPSLASTYAQALFLHRIWPHAQWSDEVVRVPDRYRGAGAVQWLSGACLMIRRSILERIGGFDEGFFMYCEDKDLCRRVWATGSTVRFDPDAVAVHVGGGGASAPRGDLLPVLASSRVRYAGKHRRRLAALGERVGVALGSLTHAVIGRGDAAMRLGHIRAFVASLKPS